MVISIEEHIGEQCTHGKGAVRLAQDKNMKRDIGQILAYVCRNDIYIILEFLILILLNLGYCLGQGTFEFTYCVEILMKGCSI